MDRICLGNALEKYYDKTPERETNSIVAGHSLLQL